MRLNLITSLLLLTTVSAGISQTWTRQSTLRKKATEAKRESVPLYALNLDLPPRDRWKDIISMPQYRGAAHKLVSYLEGIIPSWVLPLVAVIGKEIEPYFGKELADEMTALAKGFGAPLQTGHLVALNLVMQLEHIGLNCSNWNNTGPTLPNDPGCVAVDKSQDWCYCKEPGRKVLTQYMVRKLRGDPTADGPGMCTSLIAEDAQGRIFHGRNLDWNIPPSLRDLIIDVDFQRSGRTVFRGTGVVGFVGVFNGVKKGGFSVSINARGKGGKALVNLLQALRHKSKTPSQHLRQVLSDPKVTDFKTAIKALSTGELIDENYYIVGGVNPGEGAVIARGRSKAVNTAYMSQTPDKWFVLETNYDHWNPVPKADDRRTPGLQFMRALKGKRNTDLGSQLLSGVISMWPVYNHHTDYSAIMSASSETFTYQSFKWMPN